MCEEIDEIKRLEEVNKYSNYLRVWIDLAKIDSVSSVSLSLNKTILWEHTIH